jgi:hypothetical protein
MPKTTSFAPNDGKKQSSRIPTAKEAFDWTQNTMKLIVSLLKVLSDTIKEWEDFSAPNGDIDYFRVIGSCPKQQHRTRLALEGVKQTFQTLKTVQRRLLSLKEWCTELTKIVSNRLLYLNHLADSSWTSTADLCV